MTFPSRASQDASRERSTQARYAPTVRRWLAEHDGPHSVEQIAMGTGFLRHKVRAALQSMLVWGGGVQEVAQHKGRRMYARSGWRAPEVVVSEADDRGEFAVAGKIVHGRGSVWGAGRA